MIINRKHKTYAGIEEKYAKYENAKIVLIPVPFDATSTWGKGADLGPEAFLESSENMELYDIETQSEPFLNGVFIELPVIEKTNPEKMVTEVNSIVKKHISNNKFVTLFGGEHSVSIGSLRAFREKYSDLSIIQFDAHADLRASYEGSPYNHACAMHEANEFCNLIQIGIRSMDTSELKFLKWENVFFAENIQGSTEWYDTALNKLTDNVYITIDLDAFDPSIMPSTGTPEPGGLGWYQVLGFLKLIANKKNIVGFDIVELAPKPYNRAPDFLAAKLYYKLLAYKFLNKNI